jgi:ankyrin repeat protein
MAKKIEEEAQENSRFRALSSKLSISGSYQQRIYTKLRVLELCSKYDYETTWKQIRKVGNATFFCQAPEYKEWTAQAHSCTLIYTGKLGSGKSVLLANVVDDLHVHLQSKDITVTYFFCRHDIPESLKARTVIGSLARQLLRTIPDLTVAAEICDETSPTLDFEKILDLLRRTLPTDYKAYFVLDGLDECSQTDRDTLAQQLQKLQETFTLLLCISFRVEPNNALELSPRRFTATRIASIPDENPDIEAFIEAELERCLNSRELVIGEPTIILEIHDALLKGSQGMFLWVALQIQSLCAMGTDQAIRDALADLPKDLLETFSRILRRSKGLGEYNQRQILQIVTAARRPLTVDELREALSVVPGDTVWIPSRLLNNIYSALACCGCLLTVDEEELTIRFVHHSVKQFLLSSSQGPNDIIFTIESAQRIMADIVVTYLNYGVFGTQISTTKIPRIAVGSAPSRIIRSTLASSSSTQSLALKLLKSKNQPSFDVGKILAEAHNPLRSHSVHEFRFYSYAESHWLQHILCISEQEPTMYDLLLRIFKGNTVDIGAKDEGGRTPLERAAEGGHETVVKLLLDSGKVDANLDDSDGWMLLRRVAENGHEAVVKLLLDSGKFDANLIKAGGMTPLSQAAQNGDEVVAKLLLDSDKVDANSMDASGRTPLSRAAENGHEAIVKLLLGSGKVDANSMDASGRTPLWWAAENSYEAIVKLLLDSGKVDANSMDASGRTPLWRAAEDGHEVVVKLLLGSGKVDANSMDASGRTPLWRAAENGHEAIVKLLLGSGKVDANLQDMNGRTLMLWAADDRRKSLYSQLDASLLDCALSRQKFLPLDILRMIITKEKVEAELPLTIRLFQPSLPAKVAQQAKKVFAILVLIGEPLAIKELLSEGITDEHLPLYRETEAASTDVLTSQDGKSFRSFDAWKMAVKVDEFLTKQWLVLAPVFDTTGRHFILNEKCALPFVEAEAISHEHYSITYRGVLHRAHQRGVTVRFFLCF